MRYLALMLLLSACSSTGTSPVVDAGPGTDAGPVDAGRPDPLRLPDGGCPACERDGICQPGDQLDSCGSSGACMDCNTDPRYECLLATCAQGADGMACSARMTDEKPEFTRCSVGTCPYFPYDHTTDCIPCGHRGENCCPQNPAVQPMADLCVDGGGLTCYAPHGGGVTCQ